LPRPEFSRLSELNGEIRLPKEPENHHKALLRNNCHILVHRLAIGARKNNNHRHGYCLTAPKKPKETALAKAAEKSERRILERL